ncbi:MAG: EAL domain-containing protein [Pseudomonadota bacterium]
MNALVHILYVDDSPHDRELVRDALRQKGGFKITEAASRREFEARLEEGNYDLVLSDCNIRGFEGLQVLDAVKAKNPAIPVVILTGTDSEEIAVAAMKRGASDYVIKTFHHTCGLPITIHTAIEQSRLIEEFKRAEEALRENESRLRLAASVFEHSCEMIVISDADHRVVSVNQAFCTSTGYAIETVQGRAIRLLCAEKHDDEFFSVIRDQLRDAGHWKGEIWTRRENGSIFPTLAVISAVKNDKGELTNYIQIATDITKDKDAEERIRKLAFYDSLTGLANRTLCADRVEQALVSAKRSNAEVVLMFIDLDNFKSVNDSLGHLVGDLLLKEVASRMENAVREADSVCRLGGDEFLVLLPSGGANAAAHTAAYLREQVCRPLVLEGRTFQITCSVGISVSSKDGTTYEELLKNADTALYKAKESGRDTYNFYTSAMNSAATERLTMEQALHEALVNEQFTLHYQPKIDICTGEVVGLEALLRWNHPEMGMIPPDRFIPIAEGSNLIVAIGAWVLNTVCHDMPQRILTGLKKPVPIAVNVSLRQFLQGRVLVAVEDALASSGMDPALLELEITESVLAHNVDETLQTLLILRDRGVSITIDDFGTGYSSLAYLKHFPLDKLKIDKSFVRDLTENASDRAIAESIVNLGHNLGLKVVAEGVESEAQAAILRTLGCDQMQGFLIGHPAPSESLQWISGVHIYPIANATG